MKYCSKIKLPASTLKEQVLGVLVVTVIPVIICLFVINLMLGREARDLILKSSKDALSINMTVLENEMVAAASFIQQIEMNETYVSRFESEDLEEYYYAAIRYKDELETQALFSSFVAGYGVCYPEGNRVVYKINESYSVSYVSRTMLIDAICSQPDKIFGTGGKWVSVRIDGKWFLVYGISIRNSWFFSWMEPEYLISQLKNWSVAENGTIFLTTASGEIMGQTNYINGLTLDFDGEKYSFSGNNKNYLMIEQTAESGAFTILEAVDGRTLTHSNQAIVYVAIGCIILFGLLVPVVLHRLQVSIFSPMDRVQYAIGRVNRGILDYQIPEQESSVEFQNLVKSFNGMVSQIRNLKIRTYEDEMEKAKMQMQYMQFQIQPHFYLNALNTINAMAQFGDTELIQQMTSALSDYMRFITKTGETVTIQEEITHIDNYMTVMKIRMGEIDYQTEVEPNTLNFRIPPLLIQTLVENTIKYALNVYENTEIRIRVYRSRINGQNGVHILVTDNGKGYPVDFIESFNSGRQQDESRIGLQNAYKRLQYLYGEDAIFRIYNAAQGGACTEIWIPEYSNRKGEVRQ